MRLLRFIKKASGSTSSAYRSSSRFYVDVLTNALPPSSMNEDPSKKLDSNEISS